MTALELIEELNKRMAITTQDIVKLHGKGNSYTNGYCQAIIDLIETAQSIIAEQN